jgi:multicomponent Na+:H+ antiporter subunit E
MKMFLLNFVLAMMWQALMGRITLPDFMLGFILGYFLLWGMQPLIGQSSYFRKLPSSFKFIAFFMGELVIANLKVAWDVLTPTAYRKPGIVGIPLEASTDAEITLLALVITLTPGSLTLDVSDDRKTLYIHSMFVDDPEEVRKEIKEGFERRVLELMR